MTEASSVLVEARAEQFDDAEQQTAAATLGMWTFLATEVLFFGVLFAGYTVCRLRYPTAFGMGSRHTDVILGSIETAVLLTSSALVALALRNVEIGGRRVAGWLLCATAALGVTFLVLHGFEYHAEYEEALIPGIHYAPAGNPPAQMTLFFCLYYFITGFHSLHVMIGITVLLVLAVRTFRGRFRPDYVNPLEIAALYWHLVDIVWIFVYPLIYLLGRAA